MSPLATLIILGLAAGLWFLVVRPRLRGPSTKDGGDGGGATADGSRDRHDHHGDSDDGGSDGGGDGGGD